MFENLFYAFLFNLLIAVISPKPKPQNAQRYELSEFQVPTASEDRALPWGCGTFQVAGNVIWYGDYAANEVTEKTRVLFSTNTQVVGYRYRIGKWLTLSVLPVDSVLEIWYGDDKVFSGTPTISKTGVTDIPVVFEKYSAEGQKVPDGIVGAFRFFNQRKTEGVAFTPLGNAYMATQLKKTVVPAYPNVCHVVFLGPSGYSDFTGSNVPAGLLGNNLQVLKDKGGFVSSSPNIPALKFTLKRLPDVSAAFPTGRAVTYPVAGVIGTGSTLSSINSFIAANSDIQGDANPAFALLELLTTRVPGIGPRLSSWAVDVDSFMRAAAVLKTEGNGVSFTWETSKSLADLMGDILKQVRGYIQVDPTTGRLAMRLLRQSDPIVAVFDDTNIVEITNCERVTLDNAPNEMRVKYTDRTADWIERTQPEQNPAGIKAAGAIISQELSFIGVSRPDLASLLGVREVLSQDSALLQASWVGTLAPGKILLPGDRVQFPHPDTGESVIMRVTSSRFGALNAGRRVELEAVEDVFQDGYVGSYMALASNNTVIETPAQPGDYQSLGPVPFGFHRDAQYDHALWYVTRNSLKPATQSAYNLMVWDADPLTEANGAYADLYAHDFAAKGTTGAAVARATANPVMTITVDAGSAYTISKKAGVQCVAFLGNRELAVVTASVASATATSATVTFVARGLYGTNVFEHLAGTSIVLLYGYAIDPTPVSVDDYGQILQARSAKPSIQGPGGRLTPDYVNTPFHQMWQLRLGDYWTNYAGAPYAPADICLDGAVGGDSPGNAATFSGVPVALTWKPRNRTSQGYSDYFNGDPSAEVGTEFQVGVSWRTAPSGAWQGQPVTSVGSVTSFNMPTLPATGYLELDITVYSVLNGKTTPLTTTYIRTA